MPKSNQQPPSKSAIAERCWICGSHHNITGEHFPKKADLRHYLPRGRSYRHTAQRRNELIQGLGSKLLHIKGAPLCEACNTGLTQPYDRAWDTLRDYLLTNWPAIVAAGEFDLLAIYGADWVARSIDMQLYFAKILGCVAVANRIPIPLQPLCTALLADSAYPHLFLTFSNSESLPHQPPRYLASAPNANVLCDPDTGEVHMFYWRHTLPPMSVRISYVVPAFPLQSIDAVWQPSTVSSIVRIGPPVKDANRLPPRQ